MVQTFGNRILGGIGAPGGSMSEAFGAGVNTTLNQRIARQGMDEAAQLMRMREQEFAWKGEDREEAKRQRAAAAAAAAAARARNEAMVARYRDILGVPGGQPTTAGLTVATAPAVARDRQGPAAAPARPAGVRAPTYPPLSFSSTGAGSATVTGGGGDTRHAGGGGTDVLQDGAAAAAPSQSRFRTVNPPDTTGPLPSYVEPPGLWTGVVGNLPGAANADALLQQGLINQFEYTQLVRGSREQQYEVLANVGRRRSGADVPFFVPGEPAATAPAAAPAAEPVATEPAPAAPIPPEVNVTLPGGERLTLSTGAPATARTVQPERLTFGPQLGAMARTQEDTFVDALLAQTGQTRRTTPLPPPMGEPGAPNRAITRLLSERDKQVQLAQAALEFNDMQTYQAAAAKIMEIDVGLEAGVARLAISDARYNNAPQRLNAVWTDITGMQHEFVPAAPGAYDMYINGELFEQRVPIEDIAERTLMMADTTYAQAQAALEQMRLEEEAKATGKAVGEMSTYGQKAAIDLIKRLREGMIDIDIEAAKREYGLADDVVINTDEASGIIYAMRGTEIVAQFRPVEVQTQDGGTYVRLEPLP